MTFEATSGTEARQHSRSQPLALSLAAACIALLAVTVLWSLTRPAGIFDDPIQLLGAMFLRRGQQPNVDVYSVYPPLNSYLLAGAFSLLGESVATYRVLQTLGYLLVIGSVAALAHTFVRGRTWLLLLLAAVVTARAAGLQAITALAWSSVALAALLISRKTEDRRLLVVAGVCVGALALTRLNFAMYFGAAWVLDLAACLIWRKGPHARVELERELKWLVAPAIASVLLVIWLWGGPPLNLLQQSLASAAANAQYAVSPVQTPLHADALRSLVNSGLSALPMPTLWLAIRARDEGDRRAAKGLSAFAALQALASLVVAYWAPASLPVLLLGPIVSLLWARWRFTWMIREEWVVLTLVSFQLHYILSRTDFAHFMALTPSIAALLVVGAIGAAWRSWPRLCLLALLSYAPLWVPGLAKTVSAAPAALGALRALPGLMHSDDQVLFGDCQAGCEQWRGAAPELAAARYIQQHTQPTDHVFSGLQWHNAPRTLDGEIIMHNNDMLLYWLMRRRAGVHSVMMFQGMTTGEQHEQELVRDLEQRDVRWLVLWAGSPRFSSLHVQPPGLLDRYIRAHYERAAVFDTYECWQRRSDN